MAKSERQTLVARLLAVDSCAVSDALDSLGLPPAAIGLSPLSITRRVAGPAITVKLGPEAPAGGSVRHLGTAAIEAATPGDVIVVEHSSGIRCAGWGGVLSTGAQLAGVVAVIIDGAARDIDEAHALQFPIFGRAAIARTARGRVYEQDFNCPIEIDGITVRPGDVTLADSSGVVFVPSERLGEVVRRAERIAGRESLMVGALRKGERITEVVGKNYETMLDKLDD